SETPGQPVATDAPKEPERVATPSLRSQLAQPRLHPEPATNAVKIPNYVTLTPTPMKLDRKELYRKDWNSSPEALSSIPSKQSAQMGPNAIAYNNGNLYVLDTAGSRIQTYDADGNLLSSVPIPTHSASGQDLIVDPTDGSLILV